MADEADALEATHTPPVAEAKIGHNHPPEPTPFEAVAGPVNDYANEAQHWLAGSGVNSEAEAEAVGKLIVALRAAKTAADNARKVENEPFDKGKAAVQARYNPILKRADLAIDAAKKALAPWLKKVDEQKAEAARRARIEADRLAAEAAEAARKANPTNLAEIEGTEALVSAAKKAETAANRAANDTARVGGGTGHRAVSLRTYRTPVITDFDEALAHYHSFRRPDLEEVVIGFAREDIAAGRLNIPGIKVAEEERVA